VGLFEAYSIAASSLFQPLPLIALTGGVIVALIGGAMPGGSLPTLIVLIGFAYYLDPVIGIAIAVGGAVTNTADTIPAVLLGVPGGATGQASILDGYPLSRKGEAARALSVSYLSSLTGGLIGAGAFFVAIMIARQVVQAFGSAEFFMLALLGVTMVAIVSSGAVLKGLTGAALALGIAMVGFDPVTGMVRYHFGSEYLWDGIPLVPVLVGLFAIPEMLNLMFSGKAISEQTGDEGNRKRLTFKYLEAAKEVYRHKWLVVRSSLIGVFVGLMPGVGTSAAHWLAYTHAYQSEEGAKDTFGTGDIRGVIAPDAANNSIDGAQIVPTLAVGIPGSSHQAILMSFLVLMGLVPGPSMLAENLDKTLLFGMGIILANLIGTAIAFAFTPWLAKISDIRPGILVPFVIAIVSLSAFQARMSVVDLVVVGFFGAIGIYMKFFGWPRPPLIIALVLGEQMNKYFWLSVNAYGWEMFARPQLLAILLLVVATVYFTLKVQRNVAPIEAEVIAREDIPDDRAREADANVQPVGPEDRSRVFTKRFVGEMGGTLVAMAFFVMMLLGSRGWPLDAALFPRLIAISGIAAALGFAVQRFFREWRVERHQPEARILDIPWASFEATHGRWGGMIIVGSVIAFWVGVWLVGFHIAAPAYVLSQVLILGKVRWWWAVLGAVCTWAMIIGIYDQLAHTTWNDPVLWEWVKGMGGL
jgi:TctA family transporter